MLRSTSLLRKLSRPLAQAGTSVRSYQYKAPVKEMLFCSEEVHGYQEHYKTLNNLSGADASPEMVKEILEGMGKFCETELFPLNEVADREGCTWVNPTTIKTPKGFKEAYDQYVEGGWQGLSYPEKYGGSNLPMSLALMKSEIMATANWTWSMFPGLSKGAINTIMLHGEDYLRDVYLPPMVAGNWTGTMCLTEPQCGSDLAQVATMAITEDEGKSYKVSGTKIFISAGDHDFGDGAGTADGQVIHCVLARTPGAPEGTKGISLFLVPKFLVNEDGTLGELNNVGVDRIEDKMGCHGSPTCQMNFENSKGWLLGTKNQGMGHMFTFINTSRLGCAIQGSTAAELSHQGAVWYAKDRLAMRALSGKRNPGHEPEKAADPIIVHPDVRKNLLTQKAIAEGGRSMIYECAKIADKLADNEMLASEGDEAAKAAAEEADDDMGFLTPILKGFLTEKGVDAAHLGVQVYGGHGYIKQNKMEQISRDVRIGAIWEGTTGIQGLDLLGRKIFLQKLKPLNKHCSKVRAFCWDAIMNAQTSAVRNHAIKVLMLSFEWQYLTARIGLMAKDDREAVGSASVDYLMFAGYTHMAYHWLQMEIAAEKGLAAGTGDKEFYDAKVQTSNFYFESMLPQTKTLAKTMLSPTDTVMKMNVSQFETA